MTRAIDTAADPISTERVERLKRTYALKFVIVAENVSPLAATAVAVLKSAATLTPAPHGLAVEGRVTSLRAAVPVTPSAGVTMAWAWAFIARLAATTTAVNRDLEKKNIVPDFAGV